MAGNTLQVEVLTEVAPEVREPSTYGQSAYASTLADFTEVCHQFAPSFLSIVNRQHV